MIILVAVTVNIAINGRLFGTSKDASYQTEKAAMIEQMYSEIVAKYAKGQASITKGELVGVLEKYGTVQYDADDEITGIVTEKGYEIPIEEIWLIRTEERPEEPPVQEPDPTPPEPTDTERPTVQVATVTTSPTNASSITYTITFSEDVTGFTKEDITVENGTAVTLTGSGSSYSVEVTNSVSGTQKVSIGANVCTDGAGNGNEASNEVSIVIDRDKPTVQVATVTTSPTNASSITYTITFSENVTGFTKEDITVENGTAVTLSGSGSSYSVEVTNSGSGTQKVSIGANKCTDAVGNGNEASNEVNIVIDRDNPTVGLVTFSITAEDLESGLDNITWYYQSTETGSTEESIPRTVTTNKTASNVTYTREVQLEEETTYNCYAVITNMVGKTTRVPETGTVEITTSSSRISWETLSQIAVAISKDDGIQGADVATTPVTQVTEIVNGKEYTLNIGNEFDIEYDGNPNKVRIIGFKHDKLTEYAKTGDYTGQTYAGITFEFVYFMTGNSGWTMQSSMTNEGGWASSRIRRNLNGYPTTDDEQSRELAGEGTLFSNRQYIKQVQKKYGPTYNLSSTSTCDDYLWLLSCAEIWSSKLYSSGKGLSMSVEGVQYAWYKSKENGIACNSYNNNLIKYTKPGGVAKYYWLRSCYGGSPQRFCYITSGGKGDSNNADSESVFTPAFCI